MTVHPGSGPYPVPGDGSGWVVGACWLWCGHRVTLVVRLGTVSTDVPPDEAPLYACGPCTERLHAAVADHTDATAHLPIDGDGRAVPLYVTPGAPEPRGVRPRRDRPHRTPRTVIGRRWQRVVDGDDPDPSIPATTAVIDRVGSPGRKPGGQRGLRPMPYRDRTNPPSPRRGATNGPAVAAVGAALALAALYVPRTRTRQGIRRLVGLADESWYWFQRGLLAWLDEDPARPREAEHRPPPGIRRVSEEELARRIFAPDNGDDGTGGRCP
ncbi:hypothetical protein [Streptomyces sp. NPDC049881]|uniref:hypothetical protein n=1 Tax=Streptomyces sp. NPDC049881 TaxID=3155778 RepID=UPI00343D488F